MGYEESRDSVSLDSKARQTTRVRMARAGGALDAALDDIDARLDGACADAESEGSESDGLRGDGEGFFEDDCSNALSLTKQELGRRGEEAACALLKRRGYVILERNWTCPAGEADIIAKDEDGVLVFIEVKTRTSLEKGFPSEAVTPRKRSRYERIAGYFLVDYDGDEGRVRFDVVSILVLTDDRALVRHYINAFAAGC